MPTERRDHEGRRQRFDRMKADIARRLRPVCARMPEPEFDALVERIAAINIKYDARRIGENPVLKEDD